MGDIQDHDPVHHRALSEYHVCKTSALPVSCLWKRGPLKVLDGTNLINLHRIFLLTFHFERFINKKFLEHLFWKHGILTGLLGDL